MYPFRIIFFPYLGNAFSQKFTAKAGSVMQRKDSADLYSLSVQNKGSEISGHFPFFFKENMKAFVIPAVKILVDTVSAPR